MRRIVSILVFLGAFPLQGFAADDLLTVAGFCSGSLSAQKKKTCTNASLQICGNDDVPSCRIPAPSPGMNDTDKQRACGATVTEANTNCQAKALRPPPAAKDGGTKEICEQYNAEVTNAQSQNEYQGGRCRAAIANCLATCSALKSNPTGLYDGNIATCKGLVKSAELIEKQMAELENGSLKAIDCSKLVSAAPDGKDPAGSKDPASKTDATKSTAGNGMGGMNPQSLMQLAQALMKKDDQNNNQNEEQPQFQDCSANPMIAGCTQAATTTQSWNQATGEASASKTDDSGGNFNPTDIAGMKTASVGDQQQPHVGTPMTNAAIPNGGGQMPGGAGGGAASLGAAQAASLASSGKKVELQTGSGGGGYSQTAAGMNMKNGEGGGGYSYGRNSGGGDNGFNLSEFLPGGAKDPFKGRAIAGTMSGTGNFQIQSKDVNLFSRISERIKSRCAQGLLRDCIP